MAVKNNNNLFYTCSLIEYIGRQIKRKRYEVVDLLTKERIKRIYKYADILHCEPIEIMIIYMIVNIGFRITGILAKYMRD